MTIRDKRPPYSACLIRHGDGWDVRGNPTRRLGSLPVHQSLAGRLSATGDVRVPGLKASAAVSLFETGVRWTA